MRYFHPTIERHLRQIAGRWKMLRFAQHTGTLGAIACLAMALAGVAMWRGWIENPWIAASFFGALAITALLAWLILLIVVVSGLSRPREWIAGHLEKAHAPLLDRVNTLVFLGEKKRTPEALSFMKRIEKQASTVLAGARPRNPFPFLRPLVHLAVFVLLLAGTISFYRHFQPWSRMMTAWNARRTPAKEPVNAAEFKLPDADATEQQKPWSEVRITDPACDVTVTKVDVVPLEIEAASNQSLKTVNWALSVDGGKEQTRPLDAPTEPHYAVYQPMLVLDELQLSDWDVVSYYAKASTDTGDPASSELYFVEIRPFREDLLKMPGGADGKAMKMLGEITGLIERQRAVLRQTHHYEQQPDPDVKAREVDRKKLVDAESELNDSTNQVYAQMAAELENQPIADTLDHLAQAETYMQRAITELQSDFAAQAMPLEGSALTELEATRKNLQKFINDHPDAFKDPDSTPVADTGQTEKIAEFRDAEKAASDFLQKSLDKQKELSAQTKGAKSGDYSKLSKQEDDLEKSVSDFESQNPGMFKNLDKESMAADAAMRKAASTLRTADARNKLINSTGGMPGQGSPSGGSSPGNQGSQGNQGAQGNQGTSGSSPSNGGNSNGGGSPGSNALSAVSAARLTAAQQGAVNGLEDLKNAFGNRDTMRQIEHAHELKSILDHQAGKLDAAGSNPGSASPDDLQKTAQNAGKAAGQLKDIVDHTNAGKAFGPGLHNALSAQEQAKLAGELSKLQQAKDEGSRQAAAQAAAQSLHNITNAFDQSLPQTMQQAQKSNPLTPGDQESFDQAMKELDNMQAAQQGGSPMSPQDQAKQAEDARLALMKAIPQLYGNDEPTKDLLAQIDQDLKGEGKPIDLEVLKKLTDQIQNFRTELDTKKMEKPDKLEISHIDPSKLPPEYRERVEHYFQKLSEE